MSDLALIKESDLSLVEDNALNGKQLAQILKRTPQRYIKQRPAKGGGKWDYVTVGYVTKVLNLMFGWDWDFEVVKDNMDMVLMGTANEVVVLGRLTARSGGRTISKMQYGNKDVTYKRGTQDPLSIGNDLKAATSDCLKKCASAIGIAADIYNKNEFPPVAVAPKDTENKEDEEISRAKDWIIDKADTLKKLKEVESFVNENATEDNNLRKLYDEKEKSL